MGHRRTPAGALLRGAPHAAVLLWGAGGTCSGSSSEKGEAARACLQMSWDPKSPRLRKAWLSWALTLTLLQQASLWEEPVIHAGSSAKSAWVLLGTLCSRSDVWDAHGEGPACHGAARSCSSPAETRGQS